MATPELGPAASIVDRLEAAGVRLAAMLPDSWLTDVVDHVERSDKISLVRVTREDDGVAICAGSSLAGVRSVLLCQNAGVLVSINALSGYAYHHQLPVLVVAVARGGPEDGFFYQSYKARVTEPVLAAMGVPFHRLERPGEDALIEQAMEQAWLSRGPVVVMCTKTALVGEPVSS